MIPGLVDPDLELEHVIRYQFASQFVDNKRVLDASCGAGYGSALLAENAASVDGLDLSQEAVAYAQANYSRPNIRYTAGSIGELPYPDACFDVYVSFETLEHVDADTQKRFIEEAKRVLRPDGILIVSTPNKDIYDKRGSNVFHVNELGYEAFSALVHSAFSNVTFLSQQWELTMSLTKDGASLSNFAADISNQNAEYLVAVCSNAEIPAFYTQVVLHDPGRYQSLMDWAAENDREIRKRNAHISDLDAEIEARDRAIAGRDEEIASARARLNDQDLKIAALEKETGAQKSTIAELQQTVRNKEGHIELLLESDRELERIKAPYEANRRELDEIKGSRSWRLAQFFAGIASAIIPRGSKRRVFAKLLKNILKHPGTYLKKCTPSHIRRFFKTLSQDGASGTSALIDEFNRMHCLADVTHSTEIIATQPVRENAGKSDYEHLSVPQWEDPLVSIVIPVYNQFEYTYLCVRSIMENSGSVRYEILIGDDCSSDLTTQIEEIISGLRVIRNEKNLRFLLNCNNAAKQAKGRYILFLNNDTQVQKDWLRPLVDLIESADDIGMVGSKLVYPDGRLQEAGGILWQDGSAWNFGNKDNPDLPQYNYVKEADYISGAAIMIRHGLWKEIGGFDERFVPAYCEDSDLAFEVRKHGYRVLYQPKSVVVHFEGVTNGTDTSAGQKAYQVENQRKFFEKWGDILKAEHFPNGENVFSARDRSRNKETVLVIDHYIPQYDKDAGSRTMDNFLRVLTGMGYNVKFLGDNFYYDPQYAPHYEQMGVEMLCGNYYYNHWREWIKENAKALDIVLLSRPHISIKYIDHLRETTDARIIYYVQDLHYLREQREYELTHDPERLKIAQKVKEQELYLMGHSDAVLTPSSVEKEIIDAEIAGNKAEDIPIYCYTEFDDSPLDRTDAHDILFVGGFVHRPNEDGILWFAEQVWPMIESRLPDCRLVVIGSNPTEKVLALDSDKIKITGYVSDDELEEYYRSSRVCIIPLRYGAGVKGKTLEALYHRIPIVSTSVGLEGLEGIGEYVAPADDAQSFAERVTEYYTDPQKAAVIADHYHEYLKEHNSFEAVEKVFRSVFYAIGGQE